MIDDCPSTAPKYIRSKDQSPEQVSLDVKSRRTLFLSVDGGGKCGGLTYPRLPININKYQGW